MKATLDEQIREVKRELALRAKVFPSLVARGCMSQALANSSTLRMQATLDTLEGLAELRQEFGPTIGTPAQLAS